VVCVEDEKGGKVDIPVGLVKTTAE